MIPVDEWIIPKIGLKPSRVVASVAVEFQTQTESWSSEVKKSCSNSICQSFYQAKVNWPMRGQNWSSRTNGPPTNAYAKVWFEFEKKKSRTMAH